MNRAILCAASLVLSLSVSTVRAVSLNETARSSLDHMLNAGSASSSSFEKNYQPRRSPLMSASRLPDVVRFRETEGRGLLVKAWVNGRGPYTFAVDTGAGATLISGRVAQDASVAQSNRRTTISGLSGTQGGVGREASLRSLAVGDENNYLPSKGLAIVTEGLPADVDGILDPTESYWPLGYVIDIPRNELRAFDPRLNPLRDGDESVEGTIVAWLSDGSSRRPFVMLDGGRRALLDTGSTFGLAINESLAAEFGLAESRTRRRDGARDLGGGSISSRRTSPVTVRIGSLVLRRIPTDLLSGTPSGAPVLLGREALRPFQLRFDPVHRLIQIVAE